VKDSLLFVKETIVVENMLEFIKEFDVISVEGVVL